MKGSLRCEKTDKRCERCERCEKLEDWEFGNGQATDIRGGHTRGELAGDARRRARVVEVIFIAK